MAPKPFGKPPPRKPALPRLLRGSILVLGASPLFWFVMRRAGEQYRTLRPDALLWPAIAAFALLFTIALERWMAKRPVPRGPWESNRVRRLILRTLLAAVIAFPAGAVAGYLYQPTFQFLNGWLGNPEGGRTWALVERTGQGAFLRSPYWDPEFRFELVRSDHLVKAKGSLATLQLGRGALGARWVRRISIEELP